MPTDVILTEHRGHDYAADVFDVHQWGLMKPSERQLSHRYAFVQIIFYLQDISTLGLSFLVSHIGERPWWPIKSPSRGRKKKVKGSERAQIKFVDLRFER